MSLFMQWTQYSNNKLSFTTLAVLSTAGKPYKSSWKSQYHTLCQTKQHGQYQCQWPKGPWRTENDVLCIKSIPATKQMSHGLCQFLLHSVGITRHTSHLYLSPSIYSPLTKNVPSHIAAASVLTADHPKLKRWLLHWILQVSGSKWLWVSAWGQAASAVQSS